MGFSERWSFQYLCLDQILWKLFLLSSLSFPQNLRKQASQAYCRFWSCIRMVSHSLCKWYEHLRSPQRYFHSKYLERIRLKTPSYFSASCWRSDFLISLCERPKTPHFMIPGFSDVSTTPKNNIFDLWRHQDISSHPKGNPESFENTNLWKS